MGAGQQSQVLIAATTYLLHKSSDIDLVSMLQGERPHGCARVLGFLLSTHLLVQEWFRAIHLFQVLAINPPEPGPDVAQKTAVVTYQ